MTILDKTSWSDAEFQRLQEMWNDPAYADAAVIGKALGRSRSSVWGKAKREKLGHRGFKPRPHNAGPPESELSPEALEEKQRRQKQKLTRLKKSTESKKRVRAAKAIEELSYQRTPPPPAYKRRCAWPSGHPGTADFSWCGSPCWRIPQTNERSPYCQEHSRIAYREHNH